VAEVIALLPPCPMLEATGVPCPLCGATRAFAAAGRGDLPALLDANAVWVAYAVLAAVVVALPRLRRRVAPLLAMATPRSALALLAVVAAPAWAWALAHQRTIAG